MYCVAVDYHQRYSYLVVNDGDGKVRGRGAVDSGKEELREFLEPYRPAKAALEAARTRGLSMTGWRTSSMMWLWLTP